ncbi:MAG: amidohydrolase [Acidimicrobiia bacterium]|nr:amidohydrolase [Acidimicrobiia bacterium]
MLTRRHALAFLPAPFLAQPRALTIDTHIHLFEPSKFPYHSNGTYKPEPAPLAEYLAFAAQAPIHHAIIVHPEPYQDDHSYLEHCFQNEKPAGLFKGTCLYDPTDPRTPQRMRALVKKLPGRIVGLRIHAMNPPGEAPLTAGPIKNRDLASPQLRDTWAATASLGLVVQMHFLPHHAPAIGKLAAQFRDTPVILDHMGRAGMGQPADFDQILKLADYPRVYFKYSGVGYSSKQEHPHADAQPLVRRAFQAFGANRILWGGLGHNMEAHRKATDMFDRHFSFVSPQDRALIRGQNAARLFGWT